MRGELLKHSLRVSVFDWDRLSTDDKLGVAYLNIEQARQVHAYHSLATRSPTCLPTYLPYPTYLALVA